MTQQVMAKEGSQTLSIVPAKFETVSNQVVSKEGSTSLSVVAPKAETVSEQVMVKMVTLKSKLFLQDLKQYLKMLF